MVDDTSEIPGTVPDTARPKRPPPTIDLEPTSSETRPTPPAESVAEGVSDAASESHPHAAAEPESTFEPAAIEGTATAAPPQQPSFVSASVSPWVIAPFSGAVAAALVIGVGWMLGWPPVQPPSAEPQLSTVVDGLNARIAGLDTRLGKSDSATTALDKALASVRADLSSLHTQADKTMAAVNDAKTNDAKAAPRDGSVDLAALSARIDQIERASRNQGAALAQDSKKIADAKPADDVPLRRVIAAALLDVAVRHGDPYVAALATAKSLSPNPEVLKPLDAFASSGVPNTAVLDRDLLTIVPKLAPQPADNATTGTSIVDRLQSGAAKLVRIERTDGVGTDRGAVVARITAAALRNDFVEARRELMTLPPADRAAAQAWLDKADVRDAALAASRQFADESMTALAKPAQ
jgi:hypothetical protein